jgi:iodotyrosine deiodinase
MTDSPDLVPLDGFVAYPPDEALARARAFRLELARRRTVRDFAPDPVPREVVDEAVRAAATAPSGANMQPWHFAVIGRGPLRGRLREAAEAEERAFYAGRAGQEWLDALRPLGTDWRKPFLETAPWLVAVFAERHGRLPDGRRVKHYYVTESVGIAVGFLIAALHHAGLATLTHTPSPMGFLNEACGRPANERPVVLVVAGLPAAGARVPAAARRKRPLDEVASWL